MVIERVGTAGDGDRVPATKTKKRARGAASKLFNKFDSDRKYDPFLDSDVVMQDSKAGMEALLSMCNAVELNSVCGSLGMVEPCPRKAKEQQIMEFIRGGGRQAEKKFSEVLRLFWEGLLFEYLRSVGCQLRNAELDPRHLVMRYWRRRMLDPSVRTGFVPFYLKREVKNRSTIIQEDKDIRDIRAGLMACEEHVKETETRVRRQHDYRFVLQYFSASRDLHRTLVANVNYLANEVEQLRANVDHSNESISIMEQQFVEIETKYDQVVGGLVHRGAFQQTVEGALYSIINSGNATIKASEKMARELLAGMELGPENSEGGKRSDDKVYDHGNTNLRGEHVSAAGGVAGHAGQGKEAHVPSAADRNGQQWAAPRSQGFKNLDGNINPSGDKASGESAVLLVAVPEANRLARHGGGSSLGPCLAQAQETHRKTCTRYASQVADLEAKYAAVSEELGEAVRSKAKMVAQAREWENRHGALDERLADVESRLRAEIASAEKRANAERTQTLEASGLLTSALEGATPILVDMIATFAPRDTEALGVNLFRTLGIGSDHYAHILETKRMFKADLESRAFEIIDAEPNRAAEDAKSVGEEEVADSKKAERGRPKTKGKGGDDAAKKSKKGTKSTGKSAVGKGVKTPDKGDKADGSVKEKAAAKGKPKPGQTGNRASSPSKGQRSNAAGKGASNEGGAKAKRSASPTKKGTAKSKKNT